MFLRPVNSEPTFLLASLPAMVRMHRQSGARSTRSTLRETPVMHRPLACSAGGETDSSVPHKLAHGDSRTFSRSALTTRHLPLHRSPGPQRTGVRWGARSLHVRVKRTVSDCKQRTGNLPNRYTFASAPSAHSVAEKTLVALVAHLVTSPALWANPSFWKAGSIRANQHAHITR